MAGSVSAAVATYGLGSYLGRPAVERLSGGNIGRLSERLACRGILTVIAVRIIPVAPFTVINLFAGASHIRFRDCLIGALRPAPPWSVRTIFQWPFTETQRRFPRWREAFPAPRDCLPR
jgi:uncharacterized membrane protein YdjX (TVP38/TMEM64 family)